MLKMTLDTTWVAGKENKIQEEGTDCLLLWEVVEYSTNAVF